MGVHIIPDFPKKPDIIIRNDFNISIEELTKELFKKIIRFCDQ